MTPTEIRALIAQARAEHEAATPGPWRKNVWHNGRGRSWEIHYSGERNIKLNGWDPTPFICSCGVPLEGDLSFIASARTREPLLCTLLEAALGVVETTNKHAEWPEYVPVDVRAALDAFHAKAKEVTP